VRRRTAVRASLVPMTRLTQGLGDTEVGDEAVVPDEQDVVWLDVAMDDAERVRVTERIGDVTHDANHIIDGELSFAVQALTQRLPFDIGHRVVQQPVGLSDQQNGHDVGMMHARRQLNLASEPLDAQRAGELGGQYLDHHPPIERLLPGDEHARHSPAAELTFEQIGVTERGLKLVAQVCHHSGVRWNEERG
jgi:hypothetical protein